MVNDIQEMKMLFANFVYQAACAKNGECARVVADDFHTDTVLGKLFTKIKNISKGIDSMCGFVVRIGNISCYEDGLIEKMLTRRLKDQTIGLFG